MTADELLDPRLAELEDDHVSELTKFIREMLSAGGRDIPWVDPSDGGTRARALFLLESPGRKAVKSGFISFDNPDDSARNLTKLLKHAELDRRELLLWNACPYCVSTGEKNRNATRRQILGAIPQTKVLISKLPNLLAVVLCGVRARWTSECLKDFLPNTVKLLETHHPGAQSYNVANQRQHMEQTFTEVAKIILQ